MGENTMKEQGLNVQKLENMLEKKKAKAASLRARNPYEGPEEEDTALQILLQAELNAIEAEIKHIERATLYHPAMEKSE